MDLLFTDLLMPGGMNGKELADAASEILPSLPVLFTSGYASDALLRDGNIRAGENFLIKPVQYGDLASMIRQILDTQAATSSG